MQRTELFHLSFNGNLPEVLEPRQPDYSGEETLGEKLPNRVSFAPTVEQCWVGIYPNIINVVEEANGRPICFHLYKGVLDETTEYISHEDKLREIWDYPLSNEICVTTPIKVWKCAKIQITIKKGKLHGMYCSKLKNDGSWSNPIFCAPGINWEVIEEYEYPDDEITLNDNLDLANMISFG